MAYIRLQQADQMSPAYFHPSRTRSRPHHTAQRHYRVTGRQQAFRKVRGHVKGEIHN